MSKGKKRVSGKSARSSPSAQKKTPQRASKRAKTPRAARKLTSNHEKHLDALAKKDASAKQLVDDIRATSKWDDERLRDLFVPSDSLQECLAGATTPAEADAVRRQYARWGLKRSINDLIQLLRTALEPEPDLIPQLAEAIEVACVILAESARHAGAEYQDILAEALLPAVRSAVTLTDFVNGPCAELAAEAHAAGRRGAERWPRIHNANARRNTGTDKILREWKVGAGLPNRPTPQGEHTPITTARDRTLEAMCRLLPETMRRSYPVLPVLFNRKEKLIAPATASGALASPYKTLARFIAVVRHSEDKEARRKALNDFLAANDTAIGHFPNSTSMRANYANTRKRLIAEVQAIDSKTESNNLKSPQPAWLRPAAPALSFSPGSKCLNEIVRSHSLAIYAAGLTLIYSRMTAELEARSALKSVIDWRYRVTGRGKTGPDSGARDYVKPHLENLKHLHELDEVKLRETTAAAVAEIETLRKQST
jgi:hypothetical protein